MPRIFRLFVFSILTVGLSACDSSDPNEVNAPSPETDREEAAAAVEAAAAMSDSGAADSECEYFEEILAMLPDEKTINGLDRVHTECSDLRAAATYRGDSAEYVFAAQILKGDSPKLEAYMDSMEGAPEVIVKELERVITINGDMFETGLSLCEEMAQSDYSLGVPTPFKTESGLCVMKEDGARWISRKLVGDDIGLVIEFSGPEADSLEDAEVAAQRIEPLFTRFSVGN
ncbi:hypothetical protein ACFOZ5_03655 [Marinobacter lacisalsi]|uniref:Lipoprotein n=1 Tax=Marinobacter lacisalsi TaxID=475979 RepID=A0ABV8QG95_9GAMM